MAVAETQYPPNLRRKGSCFVTLEKKGRVRGCIGSLLAERSLVKDVAWNAHSAALEDPRFDPLHEGELGELQLSLSILSSPKKIHCTNEADLIRQLRPGIDGLILEMEEHRATFLPAVWKTLPAPLDFLNALRTKAGLPHNGWSEDMAWKSYTVQSFHS